MPTTNHKRQNPASRGSSNEPVTSPDQPVSTAEAPEPARPQPQAAPPQAAAQAPAPPPAQQTGQGQPSQQNQQSRRGEGLNIGELKEMSIQKLTGIAKELNVAGATGM